MIIVIAKCLHREAVKEGERDFITQVIGNVVLYNAISGGYQAAKNSYGAFLALLISFCYSFASLTNDCTLLMFHLSYYYVAHHIQLLRGQMTSSIVMSKLDLPYCKGSKKVIINFA